MLVVCVCMENTLEASKASKEKNLLMGDNYPL
jgi:hypothetical protein